MLSVFLLSFCSVASSAGVIIGGMGDPHSTMYDNNVHRSQGVRGGDKLPTSKKKKNSHFYKKNDENLYFD